MTNLTTLVLRTCHVNQQHRIVYHYALWYFRSWKVNRDWFPKMLACVCQFGIRFCRKCHLLAEYIKYLKHVFLVHRVTNGDILPRDNQARSVRVMRAEFMQISRLHMAVLLCSLVDSRYKHNMRMRVYWDLVMTERCKWPSLHVYG